MAASPSSTPFSHDAYVLGDDGLARWSDLHADAWIGPLETHKRLTRALDAELETAAVQRSFFAQLSNQEVATLAQVFGRFAPRASEACDASARSEIDPDSR